MVVAMVRLILIMHQLLAVLVEVVHILVVEEVMQVRQVTLQAHLLVKEIMVEMVILQIKQVAAVAVLEELVETQAHQLLV